MMYLRANGTGDLPYLMKYSRVNQAMQMVSMRASVGLSMGFPLAS
jgi:hypothetical protein